MKPEYFNQLNYQLHLKDMNLQFMREKIAAIPINKRGEMRTKLVPWIFTNDMGFGERLSQISETRKLHEKGRKPTAAILSGVGAFLTVAPYMNVDCIVSVDRNSFVLDQVHKMAEALRLAESPEEYQDIVQLEEFFGLMKEEGVDPEGYFEIEKESFGDKHFLASEENFHKAKQTMEKTSLFYSQGNFTHKPYLQELGQAMNDTDLVYANFTDLGEWYPAFFEAISEFPMTENAAISWSTNRTNEGRPQAMLSVGLDQYIQNAQSAMEGIDINYFKAHV